MDYMSGFVRWNVCFLFFMHEQFKIYNWCFACNFSYFCCQQKFNHLSFECKNHWLSACLYLFGFGTFGSKGLENLSRTSWFLFRVSLVGMASSTMTEQQVHDAFDEIIVGMESGASTTGRSKAGIWKVIQVVSGCVVDVAFGSSRLYM